MGSPYNLRHKKKNNKLETISCLKKALKNKPIHEFNPEVRLERLKLLDIDKGSCVTYSLQNKKLCRKNINEKTYGVYKYLSAMLYCSLVIIIAIYFADDIGKHYNELLQRAGFRNSAETENSEQKNKEYFEREVKDIIRNHLKELEKKNIANEDTCLDLLLQETIDKEISKCENFTEEKKSKDALDQLSAKMLFTDYALESKGAKVLSILDTKPYGTFAIKIGRHEFEVNNFFFQKLFFTKGPTSVLLPWTKPGDCWAFKGSHGEILIELSEKIFITGISIDHIRNDFLPEDSIKSAPKNFSVLGFRENSRRPGTTGIHLGSFAYSIDGPVIQTFVIFPKVVIIFKEVQVIFESNHGNKEYTCVYKIRIHGHK